MKVLHVTQGYFPAIGGTEFLVQRVSEELVNQFQDEVTVFTTNCYSGDAFYTPGLRRMSPGWEEINGVKVRRFPVYSRISRLFYPFRPTHRPVRFPGNQYLRSLYNGPIIPGLRTAIEQYRSDVVSAASFPLLHMFTALKAAHKTKRPCVLTGCLHPLDAWGFDRPMIYQAIQQADHYIALTDYEADYVVQKGANPDRVTVAGVGVDLEPFREVADQDAKQHLGFDDAPLIGFIGQVAGHKGVDTVVRAMPLIWEVIPEAKLLIAGARTLFADTLENLVRTMPDEAREKIIFCYNFPDQEKPWLFSAIDVLAYPSGFESFGISFLEAWAAKKPVIGCNRGATPWVIDAGQDGLLVEFQNEKMLAEALLLLLKNPAWAVSLGENGYQKVLHRYNWPAIGRQFREVYSRVLT